MPFEINATPKGGYTVDITYRPAKCEDLEEAERVVQEAGNELRVRHSRQPWPAPPPIAFPKFCLSEDPDGLWVAEHGDTIVGFGFSWMTEKFWFLSQLFVRPETQAKGVGQALLSHRASGLRCWLCLYLRRGPCRPTGNRTGR
jgi:ribosomal protein S18 acetylase RimI-like enzyme